MMIQLFLFKNLDQCDKDESEYTSRLTLHIEQLLYLTKSKNIKPIFDKIEKFLLCLVLNFSFNQDNEILSVLEFEIIKKSLQLYKRILDGFEEGEGGDSPLIFRVDIFVMFCNHLLRVFSGNTYDGHGNTDSNTSAKELIKNILRIWSKRFPSRYQVLIDLAEEYFNSLKKDDKHAHHVDDHQGRGKSPLLDIIMESREKKLSVEKTMILVDRIYNDEFDDTYSEIEDTDKTTNVNEQILMDALIKNKSTFQRENRNTPLRRELSASTGLTHEQIEGWYSMFTRDLKSKSRIASFAASKGILLYEGNTLSTRKITK